MRRPLKKRHVVAPDLAYRSVKVAKLINSLMWDGKKSIARGIVYGALEEVKKQTKGADPLEVFEEALRNITPTMEVRSRRVGGANYQVPREVRPERRLSLAMRWMIAASRSKKGVPTHKRLAEEIVAASKGEGAAVKKREDTHKMADANRAFAHFAW